MMARERLHQNQSLKIVTVGEQMVTPKITLNPIGPGWARTSVEHRMTEHNPKTQGVPFMAPRPLAKRDHALSVLGGAEFLPQRLSHVSRHHNDSSASSRHNAPSILIAEQANLDLPSLTPDANHNRFRDAKKHRRNL